MTTRQYTEEEIKELFEMANEGMLPKDFSQWYLKNNDGQTIAHETAKQGYLPENFGRDDPTLWAMQNHKGETVLEVFMIVYRSLSKTIRKV